MFREGQYFAPVIADAEGSLTVQLGHDHPGFADPVYRARRDTLATLAAAWSPGDPVPDAPYTDDEHRVWQAVSRELEAKHETFACRQFLDGKARLALPADHVPQLAEVTRWLAPLTGFSYQPAAGLVPLREFYGALADRRFWATQYIRHHSVPLYTPEPDVIHEVMGHGATLANDDYAALYEAAGRATRRVETAAALEFISKVFWFTLEFGVVREPDGVKAYGSGILSSPGEITEFRGMQIEPLDLTAMGTADYDITRYQKHLFVAASFGQVADVVGSFWDDCDDDSIAALTSSRSAELSSDSVRPA